MMNGLLLIDDDEGVRRSITRALKREPYAIHVMENGERAIDYLQEHAAHVSVVICDYKMPGMNGIETLQIIGRLYPEITRIVLTGYATMNMAIDAVNHAVDGFLMKPFDNVELRAKIREIQTRRRLRQFVSEQVYREIAASPDALSPRFHEATILFSDIRGFTKMSRDRMPEEIAEFLNVHYFVPMGEIVYANQGTTDKWIGDSIMAVFGAFHFLEHHAVLAVKTAIAMQHKAEYINRQLAANSSFHLKIGIGISSGRVFSGILGSLRKKEFTSIGMPVNLASRLQSIAKSGEILISRSTREALNGSIPVQELESIPIKGFDEPVEVFRVEPKAVGVEHNEC